MMKKIIVLIVMFFALSVHSQENEGIHAFAREIYDGYMTDGGKFFLKKKYKSARDQFSKAKEIAESDLRDNARAQRSKRKITECDAKLKEEKDLADKKKREAEAAKANPKPVIVVPKASPQPNNSRSRATLNALQMDLSNCEDLNMQIIDDAVNTYISCADDFLKQGNTEKAIELYQKALNYDSANEDAKMKLSQIEFTKNNTSPNALLDETDKETLFNYFAFSLEQKDFDLADKIKQKLIASNDIPETLDRINDLYFEKTNTNHFDELFLSNTTKTKEYRDYFIFEKVVTITNPLYLYYYNSNLISLDLAYLQDNPKDSAKVKEDLSNHYNSWGWYSLLLKKYDESLTYFNKSLEYDKNNKFPYSNFPHIYLLTNQYDKAKAEYLRLKDVKFDSRSLNVTYGEAFLSDFDEFVRIGLIEKGSEVEQQMNKIIKLLEK